MNDNSEEVISFAVKCWSKLRSSIVCYYLCTVKHKDKQYL